MVTSLRFWLICSFGTILLICLLGISLFINALNKSKKLDEYHSDLKTTRILILEINKLKEDILLGDLNETRFYESNFSAPEKKFKNLSRKTNCFLDKLSGSKITIANRLEWKIDGIKREFMNYNKTYHELIYLYKLKGFKNYGLEGKMRDHAHAIYDFDNRDIKFYCLMLRRHEKDFLLRKDYNYVQKFNEITKTLIDFIYSSNSISESDKNYLLNEIYYYGKYFKQLARIENKIGARGRDGYINRSKRTFDNIASLMEEMDNELRQIKEAHKEKLRRDTIIVFAVLVVFLIGVIIVLTQLITRSVKSISNIFNKYVNSGFSFDAVSYKRSKIKEFNSINVSFLKMAKEINIFTNFFREKVLERTLEINQQKDEILIQQEKIEKQYVSLLKTTKQLTRQKQMLAIKNTDIHDSLRYAKRIQKAIQPKVSSFKECFNDSFIFSKARDVVSGDFYLVYKLNCKQNGKAEKVVFVASDCTGHGVPGAIMSVLGINTINKLVKELKHTDPGKILNLLDRDINQVLAVGKKQDDIVADGMDISVFSFDPDSYLLDYSIAKFSHYIVRDQTVFNLDTQKTSIGYSAFDTADKSFHTRSFQLKPGDCLYLFSDGFGDQFGGPLNKKYKKSNIKLLIENVHQHAMDEQRKLFKQEFKAWKGSLRQIDDVTVIGIRF